MQREALGCATAFASRPGFGFGLGLDPVAAVAGVRISGVVPRCLVTRSRRRDRGFGIRRAGSCISYAQLKD